MDFQTFKAELNPILATMASLVASSKLSGDAVEEDDHDATIIQDLVFKLENERFTVGVVGVFNTGKSTLLNAMMGRDFLSTYILPETASITTLQHGSDKVDVHYWTRDEWARLEQEAQQGGDAAIAEIIGDLKSRLGSTLDQYITASGRTDRDVPPKDLPRYTAANSEDSYAMLVRDVEVFGDFDFCRDNISIVDTPGLNDPIRLREWVTEHKFLPYCDLILFLLPATMAFTRFDKEFIERQLDRKRMGKVFYVITKCDQLNSDRERTAVMQWSTDQIRSTLRAKGATVDNLEVFPVAARQALWHREASSGDRPTMDMEATGLLRFEKRLRQFLFEGERAIMLQRNVLGRGLSVAQARRKRIQEVFVLLDKDLESARAAFEEKQSELTTFRKAIDSVNADIDRSCAAFDRGFTHVVKQLEADIQLINGPLLDKCLEELDEYLDSRTGFGAAWNIKKWAEETLSPTLSDFVSKEVDRLARAALEEIAEEAKQQGEVIRSAYERTISINGDVIDFVEDGGGLLAGAALDLAIAQVVRMLLPVLAAMISAELAVYIAGALSGPIGWALLAIVAVWTTWKGNQKLKEKIRSKLTAELPGQLREPLAQSARKVTNKFEEQRPVFVAKLQETLSRPAQEIIAKADAMEDALRVNLAKMEQGEAETASHRALLSTELSEFKSIASTIQKHFDALEG